MTPGAAARLVLIAAPVFAMAAPAHAQTAKNVAVVINDASEASVRVGEYYVQRRNIPPGNVIRLRTAEDEQIDRAAYTKTIERPIGLALSRAGLQDRVLYLVLTKGVPLRIAGTEGRNGTGASVDSELALLYRRMTGRQIQPTGPVANPYFLGRKPLGEARPFTHRSQDIFLVARLDAFTVEDAIALIDRAQAPATNGRIVLDQLTGRSDTLGDRWLSEAADRLREHRPVDSVLLENTPRPARNVDNVLGYFSWGWNDRQNRVRQVGMRFVPGALAASLTSADARTFQKPPDEWVPGDNANRGTWFAGSPQSLVGDLIREGATGVAGNVAEPFLAGAVRPAILFPAYLAGFNLVEAFYLSLPFLSWQAVVIGDPLCAPFRKVSLAKGEIEDPMDQGTELPGILSQWQKKVAEELLEEDIPPQALTLILKATARLAREDTDGARRALEEATALAPKARSARLHLASLYEEAGNHAAAIERYRQVLALEPNNVLALNNLAFGLAVYEKKPEEALPYARRAAEIPPISPQVIDTLAWVEHLLGNNREAARLLAPIVQKSTGEPEIHIHAAVIHAALGEKAAAWTQLDYALRADPRLAARDDVKALRARLEAKQPAVRDKDP